MDGKHRTFFEYWKPRSPFLGDASENKHKFFCGDGRLHNHSPEVALDSKQKRFVLRKAIMIQKKKKNEGIEEVNL